tara:strand:- start:1462 stop:1665 length:204 start_codon:yes stop_codon:yes gene_type:complete
MTLENQGLLSQEDARKYLGGIGLTLLYELKNTNKIEHVKIKGRTLFLRESLDDYIQGQREFAQIGGE